VSGGELKSPRRICDEQFDSRLWKSNSSFAAIDIYCFNNITVRFQIYMAHLTANTFKTFSAQLF